MKIRPTSDTTILVGGALLGVAAMYFMDPDVGSRRRRRIVAAAGGAYDHARDAVSDRLHHLSGHVKDLAHHVTDHVGPLHQHAAGDTQALADQAHDVYDELSSRAKDWRRWVASRAADAQSRAQSWLGHEERHAGAGSTAVVSTAVGCCAVGAGMMYFMDPLRGRSRREQVWNQTSDLVCSAGRLMRATGKDLANRFYGAGRSVAARYGLDSRQLIDDIRAQVGIWIANPNDVQFMADADGTVTITGSVVQEELENFLVHLHDIPGVCHVINRLNVREPSAAR